MVIVLAIGAVSGCQASGAKYPNKPINMIVHVTAGSPLDIYAREAARAAEKILKVSIPVENRAGGGGAVAFTYLKSQPADGYTIASNTRTLTYTFAKPDSPVKTSDFDWLISQTAEPTSFCVRADSPFKTLDDVIKYAKENPGKLKVGGALSAGFHDAMMNKFSVLTGIKMTWVAFDGGAEAATALLGGHLDASQMTPSSGLAMIMDKKVRVLAVSTDKRLDYLPDVPTYKELGVNMVEWLWRGMTIKKGAPPEVLKTLHDAFKQGMESPEWKEYLKKNQQTEVYMNTEDFNKLVAKETEEAAAYLKEIGMIK